MKLILSTDALPEQPVERILYACRRRGIEGLEVVVGEGQAHGLDAARNVRTFQDELRCPEISVEWLYARGEGENAGDWTGRAGDLGAGLVVSRDWTPSGEISAARVHTSEPESVAGVVAWADDHDGRTAWEVDVHRVSPETIARVLERSGRRLRHIRLIGGGPEVDASDGEGTGELFRRLALSGYQGTVALVPSSVDRRDNWREWLLERRDWGCNTAAEKKRRAQAGG